MSWAAPRSVLRGRSRWRLRFRLVTEALPGLMVSAVALLPVARGLRAREVDPTPLLDAVELKESQLSDVRVKLSHAAVQAVWNQAVEVSGDPSFGLHVALEFEPGDLDVVDYLIRNSETLQGAFDSFARYIGIVADNWSVHLRSDDTRTVLTYGNSPRACAPLAEAAVYGVLVFARQLTGAPIQILEASFQHDAPPNAEAYQRVFGAPAHFSADHDGLTFSSEVLQMPVRGADPRLRGLLTHQAEELLQELPDTNSLSARVCAVAAEELDGGNPNIDNVAHRLGLAERTLRRKLQVEGTSYQQLLDDLRQRLAKNYLDDPRLGISEVAFRLGFSDPSAMHKAFKRWTGVSPSQYRQQARA